MKTFKFALPAVLGLVLAIPVAAWGNQVKDKDGEPTTPANFILKLANCSQAEIQTAELAKKNASSPKVKEFAEMLIKEHDKCRKDMLTHFKDLKIGVVATMEKEDKDTYDRLAKLEGQKFDTEYLQVEIKRHEKALDFLKVHATKAENPSVKEWAQKQTKAIQDHLKQAQEIQKSLNK